MSETALEPPTADSFPASVNLDPWIPGSGIRDPRIRLILGSKGSVGIKGYTKPIFSKFFAGNY